MKRPGVVIFACASAVAALSGCDSGADQQQTNQSNAEGCTIVRAGGGWWNQAFPEQRSRFYVEIAATPSATNVDDVIGLSAGAATKWASLAAIVRFNPQGQIDARNGGVYASYNPYYYAAGKTYFFRFDVDLTTHTYSVWLKDYAASDYYTKIADHYAFRTEQASVTRLDNIASFVNPATSPSTSSVEACGMNMVQDDSTADGCLHSTAGGGFANMVLPVTSGAVFATFRGRPSASNMDAVIGFTSGAADDYNDYGASLRFYTNGFVEARDGDSYRADAVEQYVAGQDESFQVVVDVPSKTYSVVAGGDEIAHDFHFRTQQLGMRSVDHAATIVASAAGTLDTCGIKTKTALFARSGYYDVEPLANDELLIASDTSTQKLDASGATVGRVERSGPVTVDSAGNIYMARITGNGSAFEVDSYTSSFGLRYNWTWGGVGEATFVDDLAVTRGGEIWIVLKNWQYPPVIERGNAATGDLIGAFELPASTTAVTVTADGYALARRIDDTHVAIERYATDRTLVWNRTFEGGFVAQAIAMAPDGSVAFGGEFWTEMNFGDRVMTPFYDPESSHNAYIVALGADGALRFSRNDFTTRVVSIAATNTLIAYSSQFWTQLPYVSYGVLDTNGNGVSGWSWGEWNGMAGKIALATSGRVYFNVDSRITYDASWPYLFAF